MRRAGSLQRLTASCGCHISTLCVLGRFVYTLHFPHCAIVMTVGVHWVAAIGFDDCVYSSISEKGAAPGIPSSTIETEVT